MQLHITAGRPAQQPRLTLAAAPAASVTDARQSDPQPPMLPAHNSVSRLYEAVNNRDAAQLESCFGGGVEYKNLALMDTFTGATAVAAFYRDSMRALPDGAQLVLEQQAGAGSTCIAVVWRLVLPSSGTTISRGVAFFTLDAAGRISSILDSPEHAVKFSAHGLTVFGPLLQGLAGPMLPAVQELGRAVQQGMDLLLQPLEGMTAQADVSAPPGNNSTATDKRSDTTVSTTGGSSSSSSSSSSMSTSPSTFNGPLNSNSPASMWQPQNPPGLARPSGSTQASNTPAASLSRTMPATAAAAAAAAAATGGGSSSGTSSAPAAARLSSRAAGPAVSAAVVGAAAVGQQDVPDFSGLWVKVPERSDRAGYEAALDVLGLSGLQKVTARLIDGLEVQQSRTQFTVSFVTVVPFFRVTEAVPLDGGSTQLGRRDLRFGRQTTTARSVPGGVLVEMSWGPPMAGGLTERYSSLEDGCLCVEANTRVGDKAATSKTVYRRSSGSRDQLLAESKQRNPSVASVLQQQRSEGLDV